MQENILQRPFFYDVAIEENTIFFPIMRFNALCKGSLINDEVEILNIFPDIPTYILCSYKRIYKYKNFLLFVSYVDDDKRDFVLYDLAKSQFFNISNNFDTALMSPIYGKDECLYYICLQTTKIFKIDLKSHSVQCISSDEYIINNPQIRGIDRAGDFLYIPVHKKRIILVFNFLTEQITHYNFPSNVSKIQTLCQNEEKIWITTEDKKIYMWELGQVKAHEAAIFPDSVKLFYHEKIWFAKSFIDKNILWLFPTFADAILKYNILSNEFETLEIEGEEESAEKIEEDFSNGRCMAIKYSIVQKYDNKVFFLSSKTRILYELNLEDNSICRHILKVINIYNNQIYPPVENGIMLENNYTEGLKCLIKCQISDSKKIITQKSVGQTIYKTINDFKL